MPQGEKPAAQRSSIFSWRCCAHLQLEDVLGFVKYLEHARSLFLQRESPLLALYRALRRLAKFAGAASGTQI